MYQKRGHISSLPIGELVPNSSRRIKCLEIPPTVRSFSSIDAFSLAESSQNTNMILLMKMSDSQFDYKFQDWGRVTPYCVFPGKIYKTAISSCVWCDLRINCFFMAPRCMVL